MRFRVDVVLSFALCAQVLGCLEPAERAVVEARTARVGEPVAASRQALTTVSTLPGVDSLEIGTSSTTTVGQGVTVPAADVVLQAFTVEARSLPATRTVRGLVYAWDGAQARGEQLFASAPITGSGVATQNLVFDTGPAGIALTGGGAYVLFITMDFDAGSGMGNVGLVAGNAYPAGKLAISVGPWTTTPWSSVAASDLAFSAKFERTGTDKPAMSLASSPNPAVAGEAATFQLTVAAGAGGSPTGWVTFRDGGSVLAVRKLEVGGALISTAGLGVGSHAITASYGGSLFYAPAETAVAQVVNPAGTSTTVLSSSNPALPDGGVTFTAQVQVAFPGAGQPTGRVTFRDGATVLGADAIDASGEAKLTASTLAGGTHMIRATYEGDGTFATSSGSIEQLIGGQTSVIVLDPTGSPSSFGSVVTLSAKVSAGNGTPTGSVTFKDGANVLGSASLDGSGSARLTTSALAVGSHALRAEYGGDAQHGAASAERSHAVDAASSRTALAALGGPGVFGQSVSFIATVTGPGATPTGTVAFLDGTTMLGVSVTNGAGQATFSTGALAVGTRAITARFEGSSHHAASSSNAVDQQVNPAQTATAVTSSSTPSSAAAGVTFTATVAAVAPGAGVPGGTVTLKAGATALGTVALGAGGIGALTTTDLGVGSHSVTAVYSGSGSFSASTSADLTQLVDASEVGSRLTSSANPSSFGSAVTFTLTIAATTGGVPTGSVVFRDGSTELGTRAVNGAGSAAFSSAVLGAGNHIIAAHYGGDPGHPSSAASLVQRVEPAATTTTLVSAANPAVSGQAIEVTATVGSAAAGPFTGTVTFSDGASAIATVDVGANGVAVLATSELAVATHVLGASYSGDANFAGSTATALRQVVSRASTTTTLVPSANPAQVGSALKLTATVAATAPGGGEPSGSVTFTDGPAPLGVAALAADGTATLETKALSVGFHTLSARYAGDGKFGASVAEPIKQAIGSELALVAVSVSPSGASYGEGVRVTVTVTGSLGTPTGEIELRDGEIPIANPPLDAKGVAHWVVDELSGGMHMLIARYSGDAAYAASSGAIVVEVDRAATTIVLDSSQNPADGEVTFTATVAAPTDGFTGDIEFFAGQTSLGTVELEGDSAAFTTDELSAGVHAISAVYSGDTNFAASTSSALPQQIGSEQDAGAGGDVDAGTGETRQERGCSCRIAAPPPARPLAPALFGLAAFAIALRVRARRRAR